ncbi:acetate--CoA ligase family protein [Ornithinimicrobium murale]|uniref:acetate--CoA ligase family protein n=1 Tax=Ornithinimicrobium murale TaxID=1050153 RepID=UPI000E0D575C|nr:acetate--CoA ligase family protein [Ornithinimicrobium murale]
MTTMDGFFTPSSVALVGATDKSGWSLSTFNNLRDPEHGYPGEVYLVNPRTEVVHDTQAYPSLTAIGKPVDLAYVMTPVSVVPQVLREGAALGTRHYVVLTAGYGEIGGEGAVHEQELADLAEELDLVVLGPNGNGFINAAMKINPYGLPIPKPLISGNVGVVLQSGGLASNVLAFAQARNIGVSLLTSMGNETVVSVTDVVSALVDDPNTKSIALFLEAIRNPEEFREVAARALAAGKPIVALKVGRSEKASRTAQAHTGALVGDDKTVDAVFKQLGIVRVESLEDLMVTAGLLAETGPLPGRRIGVVTPSGGASEIIADRAEMEGLDLPDFSPETTAALEVIVPPFATVANPLDVTGFVLLDRTLLGRAAEAAAKEPGIDLVVLLQDLPKATPSMEDTVAAYTANAQILANSPVPVVVMGNVLTDINEVGREITRASNYPMVLGGIEHGMAAIGHAVRWSETYRRAQERSGSGERAPVVPVRTQDATGVWAEHRAGSFLREHGVPIVPTELVSDAEAAAAAADQVGYPVVLKAAAEGLAHKSDIGGVHLGLVDAEAVSAAFNAMQASLAQHGHPDAEAIIQPMRSAGTELLVGVVRDPQWGPTLAVAMGGIWVEVMADSALRVLPVDRQEVREALEELRGVSLLRGARGMPATDLDALAAVIHQVGEIAVGLGEELESLEINPLLVHGDRIEALDALITWRADEDNGSAPGSDAEITDATERRRA